MRTLLAAVAATLTAPAAATDCAALLTAKLPLAEVTAASLVPAGTPPLNPAADVCRVTVTARPTAGSEIRIEVWIPQGAAWNGKFVQVGNGGFAGSIPYRTMALGLAGSYAVAGTDNGHQDEGISAKWALGHPEKIVDFGWRAVKTTTDVAKAVLAAYGKPPTRAYFLGCSDGGREALMTAQRYPADFEGIVAGAPAHNWTALMASGGLVGKILLDPAREIPKTKLPALQAAALASCGQGKAWIANPQSCRFDPGIIACTAGDADNCLTPGQVATARMIYKGVRNPATGKPLYGLRPGAEAVSGSWADWSVGGGAGGDMAGFAHSFYGYMVRQQADFRLSQLTDADLRAGEQRLAPTLNATSANLTAFRARGGKLVQFHGWNDPAIAPDHSLAYAAALERRMGDTSDFYRLYMVPGMLHCGGGASPVKVDWLAQLDAWVDRGSAPGVVTATAPDGRTQALAPVRGASAPRSDGKATSSPTS